MSQQEQQGHINWINKQYDEHKGQHATGYDHYVASQGQRYQDAVASQDWDLANRLVADSKRVGYALPDVGRQQAPPATSMEDIIGMLGMMSGAYVQQQQGALESMRQNQLTQLEKAYSDAVMRGDMSVREAEQQFNEQAQAINQASYQDAERIKLYGQEMGIQNSQQMAGLMQGADTRKNRLINQNITTRDRRINDIKDRVNNIITQRDLDVANINAQYDAGMQQAQATAMMNMGRGMFDVMRDDYTMGRQEQHAIDLMNKEQQHAIDLMGREHGYNLDIMKTEHGYNIDQITAEFKERAKLAGIEASHQLNVIQEKLKMELEAEDIKRKKTLESLKRQYLDEDSDEFKIAKAEAEWESSIRVNTILKEAEAHAIAQKKENIRNTQLGALEKGSGFPDDFLYDAGTIQKVENNPWSSLNIFRLRKYKEALNEKEKLRAYKNILEGDVGYDHILPEDIGWFGTIKTWLDNMR